MTTDMTDPYEDYLDDYEDFDPYDYDGGDNHIDFADPGRNSALRAETPHNPRNRPCPACGQENVLTPRDIQLGYQCDNCADRAEGTYRGGDY